MSGVTPVTPVIFWTVMLGVGSIRQAAKVSKVGGLALGYFLVMSTVALTIGLPTGYSFNLDGTAIYLDDRRVQGRRRSPPPAADDTLVRA